MSEKAGVNGEPDYYYGVGASTWGLPLPLWALCGVRLTYVLVAHGFIVTPLHSSDEDDEDEVEEAEGDDWMSLWEENVCMWKVLFLDIYIYIHTHIYVFINTRIHSLLQGS